MVVAIFPLSSGLKMFWIYAPSIVASVHKYFSFGNFVSVQLECCAMSKRSPEVSISSISQSALPFPAAAWLLGEQSFKRFEFRFWLES
jgi:hypothetical protein